MLSISCNRKVDQQIAGIYKSDKKFVDRIPYLGCHFLTGSTIILNADSTFSSQTCSTKSSGKWKIVNDSIYLVEEILKFRIDSLNHLKEWQKYIELPRDPIKYKIDNEKLSIKVRENGITYVEILYKR